MNYQNIFDTIYKKAEKIIDEPEYTTEGLQVIVCNNIAVTVFVELDTEEDEYITNVTARLTFDETSLITEDNGDEAEVFSVKSFNRLFTEQTEVEAPEEFINLYGFSIENTAIISE